MSRGCDVPGSAAAGEPGSSMQVAGAKACAGAAAEPEGEQELNLAVHPSTRFESPSSWGRKLLGGSYVLLLVVCAFLNTTFVLWPLTLLRQVLGLSRRAIQPAVRIAEASYFAMLTSFLEGPGGVKMVVTTDDEAPLTFAEQDQVLLICNHRSEVDWIFFWSLAMRLGVHDRVRVMMKAVIRHVPGIGWALLLLEYPLINRNWATDQVLLSQLVASYKELASGSWLAMFPEGTALYDKTLQQSHDFAQKRGEPQFDYVLHPRVRGFELCAEQLDPEYVVDLTVAYPELSQGIRPSPVRFLNGQYPTEVHIHVQRFHRTELVKHKGKMDLWVKQRFAEKEELLKSFYEHGAFVCKKRVWEDSSILEAAAPGVAFNLLVCALATYLLYTFPVATSTLFAVSTAMSVYQARRFGN